MPTVLFRNAAALTMDPYQPTAQAVLVKGDRIVWVGQNADIPLQRVDRTINCGGATLLPGINDAHIHLLAYAASLRHIDLGPDSVAYIADIRRLVEARAQTAPAGQWIRGRGYDESQLKERRYPTRADLDSVTPHHPVRLDHRSGHACVLNSLALRLVGIGPDTPDPPDGIIERDQAGQPTGVLLEMNNYVSQRMQEFRDPQQLRASVAEASQTLLRWGVTSLQDASPENDWERWGLIQRTQQDGLLRQRLTMMPGIQHIQPFLHSGLSAQSGASSLRLGPAKLMVTLTTGALHPPVEEISDMVFGAHQKGFPVALHAVEEEAIIAALEALLVCRRSHQGYPFQDRIEHCSEATPRVQRLLKGSGITVVAQPGFVYESGRRYADRVPLETQPWLYPLRALLDIGVALAAGSDAPVASPDPWRGLYAAITRKDASGLAFHPEQALALEEALLLYTAGAADASMEGTLKGRIKPGLLADMVLVDRDLTQAQTDEMLDSLVALTMIEGEVAWEG